MKLPPLRNNEKLCFYTLALLGVICIWNLHEISEKFIGVDRILSPVILLLCVLGVLFTPKLNYVKGQGRQSLVLIGALLFYIATGALTAFLLDERTFVFSVSFTIGASIVLIASVVHMTSGLVLRGHHIRIIRMVFFLSMFATLTVYISILMPSIGQFLTVRAAGRLAGLYKNPNMLALQTLCTIVFAFALSSYTLKSRYLLLGYAASAPTILLTNSRTSILSMLIVTATLSFLVFPPKYVFRAMLAFGVLAGTLIGGFAYLNSLRTTRSSNWVEQKLADRTEQLFDLMTGKITSENTGGRLFLAEEALRLWRRNPLMGNGLGTLNKMPVAQKGPHNTYLKYLGESGIFALLLFAGAWIVLGLRGISMGPRWCQVLVVGIFLIGSFSCITSHIVMQQRHINFCFAIGFAFSNPLLEPILRRDGKGKQFVFYSTPNQLPPPNPARYPYPPGMGMPGMGGYPPHPGARHPGMPQPGAPRPMRPRGPLPR